MITELLLKVLPQALSRELNCSVEDVAMPATLQAGQAVRIPIAGVTHELSYQMVLEMVLEYASDEIELKVDDCYPIAYLNHNDILIHQGHYISSQLSEADIQYLADNFYDDVFEDSYWSDQDYLLEMHYPELVEAEENNIEKRLQTELCAYCLSTQDFEQAFMLSFLNEEADCEDKGDESDTAFMRRFVKAMQTAQAVPDHIDCDAILTRLDFIDYWQSCMTALYVLTDEELGCFESEITDQSHYIRQLLDVHFKAGLQIEEAIEKILPELKTAMATRREVLALEDWEHQLNTRHNVKQFLHDPITDKCQPVQIESNKDGIILRFWHLDLVHKGFEHLVTIDYHNSDVQVLVNNASSQTMPQQVPIGSVP